MPWKPATQAAAVGPSMELRVRAQKERAQDGVGQIGADLASWLITDPKV